MNARDFVYWLQGFFEMTDTDHLSPRQVQIVKAHLTLAMNSPQMSPEYLLGPAPTPRDLMYWLHGHMSNYESGVMMANEIKTFLNQVFVKLTPTIQPTPKLTDVIKDIKDRKSPTVQPDIIPSPFPWKQTDPVAPWPQQMPPYTITC